MYLSPVSAALKRQDTETANQSLSRLESSNSNDIKRITDMSSVLVATIAIL